jgi:exopolyphosphatase/guanosine-5'-triphosphate,3'-diphosphate pyrophosphatase
MREVVPESAPPETVAAVDLGSNSFHLVVARRIEDELQILDRRRERVALAEGLDEKKRLSEEAQARALQCLLRFGERLRGLPRDAVRAVGTSSLRVARNSHHFLDRASEALGHPVEIIPGSEEARLIYLGVAHDVSGNGHLRLVVDIGGGSTEVILGRRFDARRTDSLHMGCVHWSLRFFPGGVLSEDAMDRAVLAARLEVRSLEAPYREAGWEECLGASGTIVNIESILRECGWSDGGITDKGLRRLRKAVASAGRMQDLDLPGLQPDRQGVIAGGVAILAAVFDGLGIERMRASQGALREGVLYDLLGRIRHEDVRFRTIRSLAERFGVDREQGERVRRTAHELFQQVAKDWDLADEEDERMLGWAARLHEVGLAISYSGHHKHGAYLVENSPMPGFSREDQIALAALIGGHRRKLSLERLEALPPAMERRTLRLLLLLRLAVLLNRGRTPDAAPRLSIEVRKSTYALHFPPDWLAANPLLRADLEEEAGHVRALGLEMTFE